MGKSITIAHAKKELKRIKLALVTQTNIAALQTEALQIFRAVIQPGYRFHLYRLKITCRHRCRARRRIDYSRLL
jgi:hypothetical protein